MKARLYCRVHPQLGPAGAAVELDHLRTAAEARSWDVAGEYSDTASRTGAWPGRRQLKTEAEAGEVVLVPSLAHLARSLEDLVDTLGHLLERGAWIVAAEETRHSRPVDTTHLAQRVTVVDAVRLLQGVRGDLLSEAALHRTLRPQAGTPGRPATAVNPREIADLYHAGKSQRESVRELHRRGAPISRTKLRQVLRDLRATGQLDDARRHKAITTRGGLPTGGRPPKRT